MRFHRMPFKLLIVTSGRTFVPRQPRRTFYLMMISETVIKNIIEVLTVKMLGGNCILRAVFSAEVHFSRCDQHATFCKSASETIFH